VGIAGIANLVLAIAFLRRFVVGHEFPPRSVMPINPTYERAL
jgi:hypothetical protein